MIHFFEGNRKIGEMPILSIFSKYSLISFKDEKYHMHTPGLGGSEYKIFNRTNEDLLVTVKINFWSSNASLSFAKESTSYQFSSSFLGISKARWSSQHNRVMSFQNQLTHGSIETSIRDEPQKTLLFICGLQLISYYSFLFLFMAIVVFAVIL